MWEERGLLFLFLENFHDYIFMVHFVLSGRFRTWFCDSWFKFLGCSTFWCFFVYIAFLLAWFSGKWIYGVPRILWFYAYFSFVEKIWKRVYILIIIFLQTFPIFQSMQDKEQDKKEKKKKKPEKKRPSPPYILWCKDQWNEVIKAEKEKQFFENWDYFY